MPLRSLQALCLVNFFLADVRDGLGPFLGIFLTEHHWKPDDIGFIMTAGGLAGLAATLPAGLLTDATSRKRLLLFVGCLLITVSTLLLWFFPQTLTATLSQLVTGISAACIAPVVAGITLGLTGKAGFNRQMGKNEAFNHAGNFSAAVIAGIATWYWGTGAVFILMTTMALFTAFSVLLIRDRDIDNRAARGEGSAVSPAPVLPFKALCQHSALMVVGLTLLLFHLGNAALLPMLSMRAAALEPHSAVPAGVYAAATVVISQCVMIPVALLTSARADKYGYRSLIMLALLVLPVRAAIAASSAAPLMLLPVQVLDGVAAGILGVAIPGYIVQLLNGSGHTNAGQAFIMLLQGAGAAFSPALTGIITTRYSWSAAFATLGGIAILALCLWWLAGRLHLLPSHTAED
ncbi:MFS transporter [Erwinia mallotivora]|uniref:MFS transporter n=1 Tax=Erwinia mallotivora TaxID=69222 RepID=UPI0035EB46FA